MVTYGRLDDKPVLATAGRFGLSLVVAVLAWSTLFAASMVAQTTNAEVTGRVLDPQGAVAVGAEVTLVEQTRGTTFRTVSSQDGTYHIIGVPQGVYGLEVSLAGFKKALVPDIVLRSTLQKRLDVTLEVGEITDKITVTDTAPAIETQKPTLSQALPSVALPTGTPLIGFSVWNGIGALSVLPGTVPGDVYVYGPAQHEQQQFTMDGQEFDTYFMGMPDTAMGGAELILNNASAEYARPVTGNVTIRSATNQYHGLYETNMTNPVLNATNTPWYQQGNRSRKGEYRTSWAESFTVGGPLRIPHVYDGRNKSFFNISFAKSFTKGSTSKQFASPPSLEMQAGNFSNYPKIITDPLTGQPFPGNIIPPNRISPVYKAINDSAWGGKQQNIEYVGSPASFRNNAITTNISDTKFNSWAIKADQNIGRYDVMNFSYNRSFQGNAGNATAQYYVPRAYAHSQNDGHLFSLGHTHTFSSTIVNELRVGATRQRFAAQPSYGDLVNGAPPPVGKTGREWLKEFGIEGIPNAPDLPGVPVVRVGEEIEQWPYNMPGAFNTGLRYQSIYQLTDNLFVKRGPHGLKAGYSVKSYAHDDSAFPGSGFGRYAFDGRFTGQLFADFVLGLPGTFEVQSTRPWASKRVRETGLYLQDDWAVTPNLTLNLGLRFEHETAPIDRNGLYSNAKIDFATGNVVVVVPDEKALSNVSPVWPKNLPVVTAAAAGYPEHLGNASSWYQPRVGLAWRPSGSNKSVLRGGYGLYTSLLLFNKLQTGGPFQVRQSYTNALVPVPVTPATPIGLAPLFTFPNLFEGQGRGPSVTNASQTDLNFRGSTVHNANLTYEHMLSNDWALRVSSSLNKTTGIAVNRNANQLTLSTIPYTPARRPYPAWNNLTLGEQGASAIYHVAELEVSHPWAKGLWFQANYQNRYDRTDTNFCYDNTFGGVCSTPLVYSYDRKRQSGPSGSEFSTAFPTHQFITNWIWEVPVGTGKRWMGDLSKRGVGGKLLNGVIGGWSAVGNFNARTGLPFTVFYSGRDPGNINNFGGDWADLVPGCDPLANQSKDGNTASPGFWINPACFAIPKNGTLGNSGRNAFRGPGSQSVNFNPYKDFKLAFLGEEGRLQLGANIGNLFNHPTYGYPVNELTSPNFGRIRGSLYRGPGTRSISIRMKIQF